MKMRTQDYSLKKSVNSLLSSSLPSPPHPFLTSALSSPLSRSCLVTSLPHSLSLALVSLPHFSLLLPSISLVPFPFFSLLSSFLSTPLSFPKPTSQSFPLCLNAAGMWRLLLKLVCLGSMDFVRLASSILLQLENMERRRSLDQLGIITREYLCNPKNKSLNI